MNEGIIGCGNIAPVYFNSHKFYNNFKVTACADIVHEVAIKSAEEHYVKAQTVEEILLNDDSFGRAAVPSGASTGKYEAVENNVV